MNRYTRIPYMVLRMIVYNNIMLITHNLNYFIKIVFDKNIYITYVLNIYIIKEKNSYYIL